MLRHWVLLPGRGPSMSNRSVGRILHQPAPKFQQRSGASSISIMKARQCAKIAEFRQALIARGFASLDDQAAVLGLSRSSTWMILNRKHKASGLTSSVINRILRSPRLPSAAREKLEEYVREKLAGHYGHPAKRLKRFRNQLFACPDVAGPGLQRSRSDDGAAAQVSIMAKPYQKSD